MNHDGVVLLDYLQGYITKAKVKETFNDYTVNALDDIKREGSVLYFDKTVELEDILNKKGLELFNKFKGIGGHKIEIANSQVKIGCKTFEFAFLREMIKLHKRGIRTDGEQMVPVLNLNIFFEAAQQRIKITDEGFECEGFNVSCETVEGWIK